jgi:N-acetylglucosamine kinase-like BadF-type ATPase
MPRDVVIGVDGGSTKTRAVVLDRRTGEHLGEGRVTGSTNLWMHATDGPAATAQIIQAAVQAALPDEATEIVAACVGTAGIDAPNDAERHLQAFLGAPLLTPLGAHRLRVVSDVAVIEACGDSDLRVCAIAGTGANTLGVKLASDGHVTRHQIGGLDLDLADDGSAAWIGHHAFRAALRDLQGQELSALGPAIAVAIGLAGERTPSVWRAFRGIRDTIHKSQLAALSADVVSPLAATDPVARRLLERAGDALAENIDAAARLVGGGSHLEVLVVGGVWNDPIVRSRVHEQLSGSWPSLCLRDADAATGAARIAQALADASS